MTNSSFMKVKSIAEFCNAFDLHKAIIGLKKHFWVFFKSDCFTQVLLYIVLSKIYTLVYCHVYIVRV